MDRKRSSRTYCTVEGAAHMYRSPFQQDGSWRVRRRSIATGEITTFVLKNPNGESPRNLRAARDLVTSIAVSERVEAEELAKRPEERAIKVESMQEAFDRWLATIEHEVRTPTYTDYKTQLGIVRRHFTAKGLHAVGEVTLEHVEEFFRTFGQEWTGRTKVKYLALLKRVFTWCVKHRLTRSNPAAGMTPHKSWSKAVAQSRFRGVALTEEQARALLVACRDKFKTRHCPSSEGERAEQNPWLQETEPPEYLYPATLFALRTGCRLRNVTGLRWKHLVNEMTELKIDGSEMKSGEPFHVPLHPETVALLKRLLKAHVAVHHRAPSGDGLVFGPEAPFVQQPLARALRRAKLAELDGRRVRFHDLRHSFASWCERHCTFAAVQRLLGHSPRSVTDRYVHIGMDELRAELGKLPWLEPKAVVSATQER